LTTAMVNYKIPAAQAVATMNSLIVTVAAGKMHMNDLTGSLRNVLPVAAAFHIQLADVEGALATMANAGDRGTIAGTHLAMMFKMLENPVGAAKKEMAAMGLDSIKLAQTLNTSLPDALKMIQTAVASHFTPGSVEYNRAIQTILGGSKSGVAGLEIFNQGLKALGQNVSDASSALRKGGKDVENWDVIQGNFNFKMEAAKNAVSAFMITLGMALLPTLSKIVGAITPVISSFTDWLNKSHALQNAMNFLGGVIKQIGDAFNQVFNPIKQAADVMKPLTDSFDRATGIIKPLKDALRPLTDTFDRAHGIISSTAKAVNPMLDSFDRASGVFNKTGTSAHGTVQAVNPFVGLFQGIKTVIQAAIPVIQGIGTAMQFVGQHWGQIQAVIQTVGGIISRVINAVGIAIDFVKQHIGQVLPVFQAVGNFLATTFRPVWDQLVNSFHDIVKAIQPILPQLKQFGMFLAGVLGVAIVLAISLIAGLVSAFAGLLVGVMKVVTGIIQFFSGLIQFFSGLFSLISDIFSGNWGHIAADLNNMMQGIMNMFIGIWNIITGIFSAAFGMIQGFASGFVSAIVGFFQMLADKIVGHSIIPDMINSIVNWFQQLPARALGAVQSLLGMISGFFSDLASKAIQWGSNIISNVATGITNAMGTVATAVGKVVDFIASHLPHSPAKIGPLRDLVYSGEQISTQLSQGMLRAMPRLQTSLNLMLNPMSTNGIGSSFSGSGVHQFPSMSASSPAPTIIVQQPDIILDGQRLTRGLLPHLANGIRAGTGVIGR